MIPGNWGLGRTSRQMSEAPRGAVFIWCNDGLAYPRKLARHLGRGDLHVHGPTWLGRLMFKGMARESDFVFDHACRPEEWSHQNRTGWEILHERMAQI